MTSRSGAERRPLLPPPSSSSDGLPLSRDSSSPKNQVPGDGSPALPGPDYASTSMKTFEDALQTMDSAASDEAATAAGSVMLPGNAAQPSTNRATSTAATVHPQPPESARRRPLVIAIISIIVVWAVVLVVSLASRWVVIPMEMERFLSIDSPESPLYRFWLDPKSHGVIATRSFYFYNLTNAEDVARRGARPHLKVIGPYVFDEITAKDPNSIRFGHPKATTVSYLYNTTFVFSDEKTNNSPSSDPNRTKLNPDTDLIVSLNIPLWGIVYRVGRLPDVLDHTDIGPIPRQWVCDILNSDTNATDVISKNGIFVARTVTELLWGYTDPIWNSVHLEVILLDYHASTKLQLEWNGSQVAPSPYTFRTGQRCPLWEHLGDCNRTDANATAEYMGGKGVSFDAFGEGGGGEIADLWAGQDRLWWWGAAEADYDDGDNQMPMPPDPLSRSEPRTHRRLDGGEAMSATNSDNSSDPSCTSLSLQLASTGWRYHLRDSHRDDDDAANTTATPGVVPNGKKVASLFTDMIAPRAFRLRSRPPTSYDDAIIDAIFANASKSYSVVSAGSLADGTSFYTPMAIDSTEVAVTARTSRCFGMRFAGVLNYSRPFFGPAVITKPMFLDSCFSHASPPSDSGTKAESMVANSGVTDHSSRGSADHVLVAKGSPTLPTVLTLEGTCGTPPPLSSSSPPDDMGFTAEGATLNVTVDLPPTEVGGALYEQHSVNTAAAASASRPAQLGRWWSDDAAARRRWDTTIYVHSKTGMLLQAVARGQVSAFLGPLRIRGCQYPNASGEVPLFPVAASLPQTLLPIVWVERNVSIAGEAAELLATKMEELEVLDVVTIAVPAAFSFLALVASAVSWRLLRKISKS